MIRSSGKIEGKAYFRRFLNLNISLIPGETGLFHLAYDFLLSGFAGKIKDKTIIYKSNSIKEHYT